MKINNRIVLLTIILIQISLNFLILNETNFLLFRQIISFIVLTFVPGYLLSPFIYKNIKNIWEKTILNLGVSLSVLYLLGLFNNYFLPYINIKTPLNSFYLLMIYNIFIFSLLLLSQIKKIKYSLAFNKPIINLYNILFYVFPITIPILTIMGTISLNNNGSNIFTIFSIITISIYILLITFFKNKLTDSNYSWIIYLIGLSLLLMYSLRSNHIIGFDITKEYQTFIFTANKSLWSIDNIKGSIYNACLSLTILPTIYSSFLQINNEYIFKTIMQVLAAFIPVIVFSNFKKYTSKFYSFLASFFFMSQFQFMQQLPSLIRQEIAFIFFSLLIYVLFNNNLPANSRKSLLFLFGTSMVLSHYSTTYITIIIFSLTYFTYFIYTLLIRNKLISTILIKLSLQAKHYKFLNNSKKINFLFLLYIISFTVIWYSQVSQAGDNIMYTLRNSFNNINKVFSNEMKSDQVTLTLFGTTKKYETNISNIFDEISLKYHQEKKYINYYDEITYSNYNPIQYSEENIPYNNYEVSNLIFRFLNNIQKIIKIFMLAGLIYYIFIAYKKNIIDQEFILLNINNIVLMAAILILPFISFAYNVERLYQQTLIILSLSVILGANLILKYIKNDIFKSTIISIFLLLYFFPYTGFVSQIIGGNPSTTFNNYGTDFEKFYTIDSEIKSLLYLARVKNNDNIIYMDRYSSLKNYSYSMINEKTLLYDIFPSTLEKKAYVYSNSNNTKKNKVLSLYQNRLLIYNFPKEFIETNKNIIYNNGNSKIYQ